MMKTCEYCEEVEDLCECWNCEHCMCKEEHEPHYGDCPKADEYNIYGDGEQTRSFLYIDECIEATRRLMDSDFLGPVNIGSEEMVTINELVRITAKVAGTAVSKRHEMDAPLGVRGRNSNNDLIREKLGWDYEMSLDQGIRKTYAWIKDQVESRNLRESGNDTVTVPDGCVQFIDEVCSV